jgi:transposase
MSPRPGVVLGSRNMSKLRKEDRDLQRRRMRAGRLLLRGVSQSEVARRVVVTRTTVSDWNRQVMAGGLEALQRRQRGRPSGLDTQQRADLVRLLKDGALAQGFATELWTLRRVGQLIEEKFSRRYSESQVWRILVSLGFSSQRPTARALERDEAAIRRWKRVRWPELKRRPKTRPSHCLHRRVGTERTTHSGSQLGSARADPGPAVPLQLAPALGNRRDHF